MEFDALLEDFRHIIRGLPRPWTEEQEEFMGYAASNVLVPLYYDSCYALLGLDRIETGRRLSGVWPHVEMTDM